VLDWLIHKVTMASILACLDPDQQFSMEVNVSSVALGVVLFQIDESGQIRHVAYFLKALSTTE
jgi:hypothetical protein